MKLTLSSFSTQTQQGMVLLNAMSACGCLSDHHQSEPSAWNCIQSQHTDTTKLQQCLAASCTEISSVQSQDSKNASPADRPMKYIFAQDGFYNQHCASNSTRTSCCCQALFLHERLCKDSLMIQINDSPIETLYMYQDVTERASHLYGLPVGYHSRGNDSSQGENHNPHLLSGLRKATQRKLELLHRPLSDDANTSQPWIVRISTSVKRCTL